MEEVIKEAHSAIVKAQEYEIDLIKNRLDYINWLFGISSALLLAALTIATKTDPSTCPKIIDEHVAALSIGAFSFVSIILSGIAKFQGYGSMASRKKIITLLDVQKCIFYSENPPEGNALEKFKKFVHFEYLLPKQKENYDQYLKGCEGGFTEAFWLKILIFTVTMSLFAVFVLLLELTI